MWYVLGIAGFCLLSILIKRIRAANEFEQEVVELFALRDSLSDQAFSYAQLVGLPEPVQAYFRHVLKEGEPYINYVRLKHNGQFKTGLNNKWVDIVGEQYFTVKNPGLSGKEQRRCLLHVICIYQIRAGW
ncbi:hypothetical protein ABIB62_002394 [Mucilaginibacter sp. UYP25]